MTPEEIQLSLANLMSIKISPRDQAENKALLARLERLYEQHLGELRQTISSWIEAFENVLDKQERDDIVELRQTLNQYADELEGQTVL